MSAVLHFVLCRLWWILGSRLGNKTMRHRVDWYPVSAIVWTQITISQLWYCHGIFHSGASSFDEIKSTDPIESGGMHATWSKNKNPPHGRSSRPSRSHGRGWSSPKRKGIQVLFYLSLSILQRKLAHLIRQPLGSLQEELPHRLVPPLGLEVHPQQMNEPADGMFLRRDLLGRLVKASWSSTWWQSESPSIQVA